MRRPCRSGIPACRHAAGTISSPCEQGVRRMASEDSDQVLSRLSVIHRLGDLRDLDEPGHRQVPARVADLDALGESLEVLPLCGTKRVLPKERDDDFKEFVASADDETMQMLLVIVVAAIDRHRAGIEEVAQLLQRIQGTLPLHDHEAMRHLIAVSIATSFSPIGLLDEANGEAAFSIYEADHPA